MMNTGKTRITTRIAGRMGPGARSLARKGIWALADQGVISATNFLLMVILARTISPHDFGMFALGYTGLLFLNSVQSALIGQPLIALGAPRTGHEAGRYMTATMWEQVALAWVSAAIIALLALGASPYAPHISSLIVACATTTAVWQFQEFVRRVLYTTSRPSWAFANDMLSYGGLLLILLLLWRVERLTAVTALVALSAAYGLGVIFGLWQIRREISSSISRSDVRATVVENWAFGRWLFGGNVAIWTSGKLYPILAAGFVSVVATGAMKAMQTILGPMNVLTFSLDSLFGPKAARINAEGGASALKVFVGRLEILMALSVGLYCLVVSIFASPILSFVYGERYAGYSWLLIIMAVDYVFYAFRGPMILALTVLSETKSIFRIWTGSSIVSLTFGVALAYTLGLPGIGIAITVNVVILQWLTWKAYARATGSRVDVTYTPGQSTAGQVLKAAKTGAISMSAPTVSKHMTESVETHLTEKLKVASLVAICVPTFKRSEQLEQLLQSVRALDRDSIDVHLIVVDNDVERSANSVVADVMRDSEIPVTYDCVKVPSRPRARNRLVELAGFVGADWIWFLDDDQVVMPDALRHLLSTANTYDADGVVGRVPQIFEATHRPWAQWSGLFNEVHRPMGMPTRNFGCGGILLRRTAIDRVPHPFDDRLLPEFPEDSVFLARFREKGSRIVGCDEAVILDHVSASRNNPHWILMRALRLGQANGFSVREFSPSMWNSVKWLVLGGGYGIENLLLALVTMALGPSKSFRFWVRTVRGLGIMIGVLSPSRILQHRVSSVCLSW